MGAGLLSISAYSGGGPSYQLTVASSAGVTINDHVSDGAGKIYRTTSVPDSTHINIEDDVAPDAPVGVPTTGDGAYWTATGTFKLSQAPFSAPYWDNIWRRDMRQIEANIGATGTAGGDLTGSFPDPEVKSAAKSFRFLGGLIAPIILSDQDDYSPAGLADVSILRISSDAARNITGLATPANGRIILLMNGGSYPITLKHENAGSTAANRFYFENNADAVVAPNGGLFLVYCGDSSRWRTVSETNALRNGDTAGGDLNGTYPDPNVNQSSETVAGKIEIATQAETNTGTDDTRAITPAKLASASTVVKNGEAAGGDLEGTYPNPTVKQASTTVAGKIEIATDGEVDTGSDTERAVTPAGLAQADTVVKPGDAAGGDLGGTYPNPSVKGRLVKLLKNQGTTLNPTTTDTTYDNVIPQMTETFTPDNASNWICVSFDCMVTNTNNDKFVYAAIFIDDSEQTGCETATIVTAAAPEMLTIERWFQLSAESHTIAMRWKTNANTATAIDDNRCLTIKEYSALT
jgi:hypothetical protein